ncbi:MAG: aminopeptidase P family protein [Gemmatimonadetes bacterium]|nr:aminopeptidase P family protein [Gemmatimonadota bacterium]
MPILTTQSLPDIQAALRAAGLDGWLLYDFRALNPIAQQVIGLPGPLSRRIFVLIPAEGVPRALTHNIEQGAWRDWPTGWGRDRYSAWVDLEAWLGRHLSGRRVAMEYSSGDAVPYLDRVPAGVLEMVQAAGATVVSSGELVSRFYAVWTPEQLEAHKRAAVHVARIGQEALRAAGDAVRRGESIHEHDVQAWILAQFAAVGLETYAPPNVSVGAHAADPHYEPSAERPVRITRGNVLLIDLWAKEPDGIYADQTWMAVLGPPTDRALEVWAAIRDARDAAIAFIADRVRRGEVVRGADADDAARAVIVQRGYGQYFIHRTGHSIDAGAIHGSGPNLDNLESRDVRTLQDGVGFSIEPGIYIPGDLGMRTEVNGYINGRELLITPSEIQRDLLVV